MVWLLAGLALLSGSVLPVQAAFNSRMASTLGGPVLGALVSVLVSTCTLVLYVLLSRQHLALGALRSVPALAWLGGVLGVFYLVVVIMATPRLGAALTFALVVAGQLVVALAVDRFGLLGLPVRPVSPVRLLGLALVLGGALLIRFF